jgi:hypothetical protein
MNDKTTIDDVVDSIFTDLSPNERRSALAELKENFIINFGLLRRLSPNRIYRLKLSPKVTRGLQDAIIRTEGSSVSYETSYFPLKSKPLISGFRNLKPGEIPPGHYRAPIIFKRRSAAESGAERRGFDGDSSSNCKDNFSDDDSSEDSLDVLLASWGLPKPKKSERGDDSNRSSNCPFIFSMILKERHKERSLASSPDQSNYPTNASESSSDDSSDSSSDESDSEESISARSPRCELREKVPVGHSFAVEGLSSPELDAAKLLCPHLVLVKASASH